MALDTQTVAGLSTIDPTIWKRIAVRAPNWVGDAVMALPFFAALHRLAADADIVCLCKANVAALYRDVSTVDRVIELDQSRGPSGGAFARANARQLRREALDAAFCLPTSFGSALMLWLARVPRRYGHAAEGRGVLLSKSLPYRPNGRRPHRTDGYLTLLGLVFPDAERSEKLEYRPGERAVLETDRLWTEHEIGERGPVLAIAPSAAQPNKMWMSDRFASIAVRWHEQTKGAVILLGGPADRPTCEQVRDHSGEYALNLAGHGDLTVAGELIRRAAVFVGNDSGLAHLAAAVGTRTVVISGPGDPAEVAPYSPLAHTIKHPLFCSPCYKNTCWRKDKPLECLTEVSVDTVWQHVEQFRATR